MGYLKERLKHVVRFRHKRGFGVHSPFMFNLILNVIRDRGKNFAYPETLEEELLLSHRERKELRLLFRLVSFLKIRRLVLLGQRRERITAYLKEMEPDVVIGGNDAVNWAEAEFVYVGKGARDALKIIGIFGGKEGIRQCVMISDIHRNGHNALLWRQMRGKSTVSVDMMWYGILFFDTKLQYGRYNLII